ncbi:MAG: hypothetical protein BWX59_02476 [Bacteroidetes bacterium ADurb.Bin028]|nr:MAG: hypothetical protein BWX59_02476 [Bacteroidetes bacterium ADurb.Bin028]
MKIKTKRTKTVILSYKIKLKHFEDFLLLCSYDRADVDGFINLLSRCTEVDKEIFYNLKFADLIRFVDELVDSVDKEMYKAPKKAIKINDRYYKLIDLLNLQVAFYVDFDLVEKTPSYLLALCYTETGSYTDERNSSVDEREKIMQNADIIDYMRLANFFLTWRDFLKKLKEIQKN